jgi:hypothetical protein
LDWDVGVETGQQCHTTVAKPNLNLCRKFATCAEICAKNGFDSPATLGKKIKVYNLRRSNSTLGLGMPWSSQLEKWWKCQLLTTIWSINGRLQSSSSSLLLA